MYHYNLNNVNFIAVPIIHLIDSQLIHNDSPSTISLFFTPAWGQWRAPGASLAIVVAISLIRETLELVLGVHRGVVHEVLVLSLHQEMLRRHQGLVLDHCKNKHRHKYKSTWIIALAMNRRRRILLVFMALSIGCYWHFITFSYGAIKRCRWFWLLTR